MKVNRLQFVSLLTILVGASAAVPSFLARTPRTPLQINAGINQGVQQVRMALPEFQTTATDAKSLHLVEVFNQVLWDDLDYQGNIQLISRSFYPKGTFRQASDIKIDDWTNQTVRAQYVSFGEAHITPTSFSVDTNVWDLGVPLNHNLFPPFNISTTTVQNDNGARLMAHEVADRIVNGMFGGNAGIAESKIAFQSDRTTGNSKDLIKEIWIMDYDGANQIQMTDNRSISILPRWSPDGDKLAFTAYRKSSANIEVMSSMDRRVLPFVEVGGTTTTPAWSPDGSRIAFATSRDNNDGPEIYVADWNGKNMKRLTIQKGSDSGPTWNPKTGNEIAFVSDRGGSPQLYIMSADGGNVQRIINEGGDAVNPSWSPDGQYIAFAWQRSRAVNYDIYIHNLATGLNLQLTSNAGKNDHPSWSPDGRHLVFESTRTGRYQIYTMLADGTKVRVLTKTGNNAGPSWSGFTAK